MTMSTKQWLGGALAVLGFVTCLIDDLAAQELDWVKRAGGTGSDEGRDIATDDAGNSYVSGRFRDTATFGAGEANETTLASAAGTQDIFIAKYDLSGALVWVKRAGGASSFDEGSGLANDGVGNSYMTGFFEGAATFGPGEANETTLNAASSLDLFVAKYDLNGALVWAKCAGGTGAMGAGIATESAGNSYVTGRFSGTATFGPGEAGETTLSAGSSQDLFVAKYDPDGALVRAKRAGGTGSTSGESIAADSAGNSYVAGSFFGTVAFGPGETEETTFTAASNDIFVAKYDPSGALIWAKRGTSASDAGIATDGAGNSYVTGSFFGTATFRPGEANETTLAAAGDSELFVARYDPNGALVWARRAGGTGEGDEAKGEGISVDSAGNSYVTGLFAGTATFGTGEANEITLTSAGSDDLLVAKYNLAGELLWAERAGGADSDAGFAIASDGNGSSYITGRFRDTVTFGAGEANETTLTSEGGDDILVAKFSGVPDTDGDGIADGGDNCPDDANANQLDTDGDGDGDACDADDDNDTVADAGDNCPLDANPDQADADGDGAGNVCDADLDGDGVQDDADRCVPTATGAVVNADGCSIGDLVPCGSPWKNHGAYVSTIVKTAEDFLDLGLITEAERDGIVSGAGQSQCGQ